MRRKRPEEEVPDTASCPLSTDIPTGKTIIKGTPESSKTRERTPSNDTTLQTGGSSLGGHRVGRAGSTLAGVSGKASLRRASHGGGGSSVDSKLLLTNAIPKHSTTCRTHMYTDTQADKYIHIREHGYTKTPPPQHRVFIQQQGFLFCQPQLQRQQDLGPTQLGLTISTADEGHSTARTISHTCVP